MQTSGGDFRTIINIGELRLLFLKEDNMDNLWIFILEGVFALFTGAVLWRIFIIQNYLQETHKTIKYNKEMLHKMLDTHKDLMNQMQSGIDRLSNEHTAHDSKLVAGLNKFEENTGKNFERSADDTKEIHNILHTHIKDETVDHTKILNEVINIKEKLNDK